MCICPQLRLFPRSPTQWPPPIISNKRAIGARLASVMYTHAKYVVRRRVRHGESLLVVETKDNPLLDRLIVVIQIKGSKRIIESNVARS